MKPSLKERNEQLEKELAEKKRELEIEAALESVRGRSLAMHASGELKEVANEMRNQLSLLGLKELETCAIHLYDISPDQVKAWAALRSPRTKGKIVQNEAFFPKKGIRIIEEAFEHYLSGEKDYVLMTTKAKVLEFIEGMKEHSPEAYAVVSKSLQENGEKNISGYWAVADFPGGSLIMVTMVPPDENSRSILRRFADVFGLAYRRFADLQKAEAQVREAQIETALEKVRSRSLAMHKSDELKGVVFTLFEKLREIGLEFDGGAAIHIFEAGTKNAQILVASPELKTPIVNNLPYDEDEFVNNPVINDIWNAKEAGCDIFNKYYSFEEKNKYFNYVFKHNDNSIIPEEVRQFILNAESYTATFIAEKNSLLGANSWTKQQFSKEDFEILKRFARVFEQAYIRFLDLAKAEAQAREAQIEAALEKVRSRSLAMHHSNELEQVVGSLFDRLIELGLSFDGAGIYLFNKAKRNIDLWVASRLTEPVKVNLPYDAEIEHNVVSEDLWNRIEKGEDILNKSYSGKAKNDYYRYVGKYNKDTVPESIQQMMIEAESWTASCATGENSMLVIDNWVGHLTTENDFKILKRFARVFEQAYTRFLDLQKAEAQARSAQIEAALERVRSKTMAMHKSDDLLDVIKTLGDQFQLLGFKIHSANFNTSYREKDWNLWLYNPGNPVYPEQVHVPYFDHPFFNRTLESIASGSNFHTVVFTKEEKNGFLDHLYANTIAKNSPEERKKFTYSAPGFAWSTVYLKNTALTIANYDAEPYTDEQNAIIKRFGNSFEQAYTRFLDLQKAEAQAREAQIQLALERVRAKTMAMQKPSEFVDVINVIGEQFIHLGFDFDWVNFSANGLDVSKAIDIWNFVVVPGLYQGATRLVIPFFEHPVFTKAEESVNEYHTSGNSFNVVLLDKKDKDSFLDHLFTNTIYKDLPQEAKTSQYNREVYQTSNVVLKDTWLSVGKYDAKPLTDEEIAILKRLANEFGQAYTRFLDLQKAEAQAREAQIEAALERVRSRTMAMHQTSELQEVIHKVHQELLHLQLSIDGGSFVVINKDIEKELKCWGSGGTADTSEEVVVPDFNMSFCTNLISGIKKGPGFFTEEFSQQEKKKYFTKLFEHVPWSNLSSEEKQKTLSCPGGYTRSVAVSKHTAIFIINHQGRKFTEAENDILRRFAKVFEQTYTRFLDLQKAEAQAREAQIQLGLERVRARAMAMLKSDELKELIGTVFIELTKLDLVLTRCVIMIYDIKTLGITWWMANSEDPSNPMGLFVKYHQLPPHLAYIKAWENKELKWQYVLEGKIKKEWDDFLFLETELSHLPDFVIAGMKAPERVYLNSSFNSFGNLTLATLEPLSDEHADILLRFAKVFDLTYTRFNDLKQAESQAREAQIETALERVRSRSMAMHKSDELLEVINVVSEQLQRLNVRFGFVTFGVTSQNEELDFWLASPGFPRPERIHMPAINNPITATVVEGQKKELRFFSNLFSAEVTREWIQVLCNNNPASQIMIKSKDVIMSGPGFARSAVLSKNINVFIGNFAMKPLSDEQNAIVIRFANVFEQSYTRFLDLQKAEAQAREAEIELALERVRARTMAMQHSEELQEVVHTVLERLKELNVEFYTAIIILFTEGSKDIIWWLENKEKQQYSKILIPYVDIAYWRDLFTIRENGTNHFSKSYFSKEKNELYHHLFEHTDFKYVPEKQKKFLLEAESAIFSVAIAKNSGIHLTRYSGKVFSESDNDILKRFANVFEQSYTRFLDLQKAEAQAREAQIETALEKVRSRTLAMQRSDELADTSAVLFKQLIQLGIAPNRLYIGIIHDNNGEIEFWVTDEDGSKVSSKFTGNALDNPSIKKMYDGWAEPKKWQVIDMHGKELREYFHYLGEELRVPFKGGLSQKRRIQYLAYFSKGFIGMASPDEQPNETINLLERFAYVFNLTFTRFNDLQIAEAHALQAEQDLIEIKAARKRAEDTLTELRQTQKQLIQSEKMASLGELTAGIAHEIQNPLNFVNNFSEVNSELIGEMQMELDNGNVKEAISIANDIKENEEKINYHGKRADAIVKGMLQHSLKSSGQKDPTDINALADEYLRLSYHGLRAKDKSFNATIETDFDHSIGKINIIPQDIGRVLLNLFNNAFYAVNEQKNKNIISYEPKVFVRTQKCDGKIQIKVRDNGNGIPQKIIDKIFQPFFTTKPTGEGTGLGLSLSYDIIKAHGGEIKVESKEAEGTTFSIHLPN